MGRFLKKDHKDGESYATMPCGPNLYSVTRTGNAYLVESRQPIFHVHTDKIKQLFLHNATIILKIINSWPNNRGNFLILGTLISGKLALLAAIGGSIRLTGDFPQYLAY